MILTILAKVGILKFNGKRLKVGSGTETREIIRRQIEYATNCVQEFVALMPKCEEYNEFRAKYASEKVLDEIILWICINHICKDDFYIENKQIIIWNILQGIGQKELYRTDDFRKQCNDVVRKIIIRLHDIREYYSKGDY